MSVGYGDGWVILGSCFGWLGGWMVCYEEVVRQYWLGGMFNI